MKMSKKDEARIAGIVSSLGGQTRKSIRTLPKDQQDLAWALVASAIATAAIHDAQDRDKVFGFIKDSVNTMMALMMDKSFPDDDELEAAVNKTIAEGRSWP